MYLREGLRVFRKAFCLAPLIGAGQARGGGGEVSVGGAREGVVE